MTRVRYTIGYHFWTSLTTQTKEMLRPSNQLPDDAPSQPPSTKVNQATIKGGRQLKKPTQDSYVHQRDEPGHCKPQHGFKVKGIRFSSLIGETRIYQIVRHV